MYKVWCKDQAINFSPNAQFNPVTASEQMQFCYFYVLKSIIY